jgi:hypothetical protein
MARITIVQNGQSSLVVDLDTRELTLPNGKHRDATVFANEDGVITSPKGLLDKIAAGTVKVVDLYGLKLPGDTLAEAVEEKEEPVVVSNKPKPGAKKTPAPVAVPVTPPAAPIVPAGSPLDLPEDEA